LNFAPAEPDLALDSEQKRLLALGFGRFRNIFCDKVLRIVEQHSSGLAGRLVFQNFAAERIRRVLVDLRDPQRGAVRDRGMTVGAREKYRIVRRNFIQVTPGRESRRFPKKKKKKKKKKKVSIQPRPVIHLPRPVLRDALFHFLEKIFARVRALEIQSHFPLANSEDVTMRIGQSRHHGFAAKVDNARFLAREFFASAFEPTKATRSFFTAIASARGCFSFTV